MILSRRLSFSSINHLSSYFIIIKYIIINHDFVALRCISTNTITSQQRNAERKPSNPVKNVTLTEYRHIYPEFLPDPTFEFRNTIREKLERLDMVSRRQHIDIPEFYVGK